MTNPKETTLENILSKMDHGTHETIRQAIVRNKATHLVLFENLDMCSSQLGRRTIVCIGPSCTYTTIDAVNGKWLNDLPSQRQYPVLWAPVDMEVT